MEIILVLTVGALCIACFFVGAKVGQAVKAGEKIELPSVSLPDKKKKDAERKAKEEADRYAIIAANIDRYDGTGAGQIDVPEEVNR